jgi:hypothetical protein
MNDQNETTCRCNACPGASCACGCQSAAKQETCGCGEECRCGAVCTCATE